MDSKNFLAILNVLGEALEKNELTITCQEYQIAELRKMVDKLTEKDAVSE